LVSLGLSLVLELLLLLPVLPVGYFLLLVHVFCSKSGSRELF
jgi:hypothetical protein